MTESRLHDREALLGRAWALLLVAHAEAAGLCPLSHARFHGALYLAFALARTYDVPALSHLVMRDPSGPLYPEVHREVGRLVVSGLVAVSDFRPKRRGNLPASRGDFRLAARGRAIAAQIMQAPHFETIGALLSDVAFGLGEIDDAVIDDAVQSDPTYAQKGKSDQQVIRFEEAAENRSYQAVAQIQRRLDAIAPASKRDLLATFAEVLERRAAL